MNGPPNDRGRRTDGDVARARPLASGSTPIRHRLLRRVRGMPSGVVLVVAGHGWGKSTLLGHLAATDDRPVLAGRATPLGAVWHTTPGGVSSPVTASEAAATLAALRRPTLVTLDDAHRLREPADADGWFGRLAAAVPPGVQVVVAVRALPPSMIARYDAPLAGVLDVEDLALRPYEVDRAAREGFDAPLRADDVHRLAAATDGWPAAVDLFCRATQGMLPADRRRAVRGLRGAPWYLADYAEHVLLAGLTAQERRLLMWGAAFDVLTPPRLDALLEVSDSADVLRNVAHRSVVPLREFLAGYRIPMPLRRYLGARLARDLGPAQARAWWSRAASVLESEGETASTIGLWARAERPADVVRVAHAGTDLWTSVGGVLRTDPAVRELVPQRLSAFATMAEAVADGALAPAARLLEQVDRPDAPAGEGEGADDHELRPLLGAAVPAAVRDLVAVWSPDGTGHGSSRGACSAPDDATIPVAQLDAIGSWARALQCGLRQGRMPSGPAECGLVAALLHGLAGRVPEARAALAAVLDDEDEAPGTLLAAALTESLVDPDARIETVADGADSVLRAAQRLGLTWLQRLAHAVVVAAEDADDAQRQIAGLVQWARDVEDPWGGVVIATVVTAIAARRGEDDAPSWLALAADWAARDTPVLEAWCRLGAARAAARDAGRGAGSGSSAGSGAASTAGAGSSAGSPAVGGAGSTAEVPSVAGAPSPAGIAVVPDAASRERARGQARAGATEPTVTAASGAAASPLSGSPLPEPSEPSGSSGSWPAEEATTPSSPSAPGASPLGGTARTGGRGGAAAGSGANDRRRPALEVRCLGELALLVDGAAVDLTVLRPRARSMLRMLAVESGHPVHRERLALALWPDLRPTAAIHNLHVSVSAVRRALDDAHPMLGRDVLVRVGESYLLRLDVGDTCDLIALDEGLREARREAARGDLASATQAWRAAVDRYRADLLVDEGSSEWVVGQRERVRLAVADAASALARAELGEGRNRQAAAAAVRAIELDEFRDDAWRVLVRSLTLSGEAAAAQRARQGYARVLRALGIAQPGTEVAGARRAPGTAAAAPASAASSPTAPPTGSPVTADPARTQPAGSVRPLPSARGGAVARVLPVPDGPLSATAKDAEQSPTAARATSGSGSSPRLVPVARAPRPARELDLEPEAVAPSA